MSLVRQVIAVDIDDVLSTYGQSLIEFSNNKWNTKLTIDDIEEDWAKMWKIDHEDSSERADILHKELFINLKHNQEAKPVLTRLSKYYDLVITTSRQQKLLNDTQQWLNQYFPNIFKSVNFAGIYDKPYSFHRDKQTKKELIKDVGADFLIDDQPKHCFSVAEEGKQGLLFGNYPWNQASELPPRVCRVNNWQEVERYFEERK